MVITTVGSQVFEMITKGRCSIFVTEDKKTVMAWINGISFFIRPAERDQFRFDPNRAIMKMIHIDNKGHMRCSKCGWEGARSEFACGHMAELLCVACVVTASEETANDIKTGNICRMCKKPRSMCVC
jgi:hypothetical protein